MCDVNYSDVPETSSSFSSQGFTSIESAYDYFGGSWINAYLVGIDATWYCNTSWSGYSNWEVDLSADNNRDPAELIVTTLSSWEYGINCSSSTSPACYSDGHETGSVDGFDTNTSSLLCISSTALSTSNYSSLPTFEKAAVLDDECGSWYCQTYDYTSGTPLDGSLSRQCSVTAVAGDGTTAAPEPTSYWGTQDAVLPGVGPPSVTCTATFNSTSGYTEFSASGSAATGDVGDSLSYSWSFGDGSTATGASASHTYAVSTPPDGGWTATVTVTATGDGVHESGTESATCVKVIDPAGYSTGVGGTSGTGPSGIPTSCSWTDIACALEQAVCWLVCPGPSFFTDWSSFTTTFSNTTPFNYITGAIDWVYVTGNDIVDDTGTPATCYDVNVGVASSCSTLPSSTLIGDIRDCVSGVIIVGFAIGLIAEARRIVRAH